MFIDQWLDANDYILAHTSGSTGKPKPIRLLKADMVISAKATCEFFKLRQGAKIVLPLSDDYIAGKMMVVRALVSRSDIISELPSRRPLADRLPYTVDLVAIVPQQIDGIIASPNVIRNVIVGGAPVGSAEERRALVMRPDINWWATYGMTETCSHVALRRFGENCYRALPGIKFTTDDRGCLVIEHPESSWSPVATNDAVDLVEDRTFRWLGRVDNVIISGGIKIHPEEIESKLAGVMAGHMYYITGQRSEKWGTESVLVVEGERDPILAEKIMNNARSVLSSVMCPKDIIFIEKFEYTSTGKIKRNNINY